MMHQVDILNISVHNLSMADLLSQLKHGGVVYTPNIDHLSKLQYDHQFFQAYTASTYRVCDSQILMYVAQFLGTPLQEKISGSDLLPAFCDYYSQDESMTLFLLGAAPGVADRARERINEIVNREMVVATYAPPFGFEQDEAECRHITNLINQSGATVLVAGLGAPKQEKWIYEYKLHLPQVRVFLAVGAAIDFQAGHRQRSPKWMSCWGLEWLHRLLSEPARLWRRYLLEDIPVLGLLIQQKLRCYVPPFRRVQSLKPIGWSLRQAGYVSPWQLEYALNLQSTNRHLRLGEILVEHGWVQQDTVDWLAEHTHLELSDPSEPMMLQD